VTEVIDRKRYAMPKRYLESEAARNMTPNAYQIARHLIDSYRERGDELDIILSAKCAASIIKTSHPTAMKAIRELVDLKVIKPTYEGDITRPNKCSQYRLLMFPYRGEPADHDYLTDRERRGVRRNHKPREMTVRTTEDVLRSVGLLGRPDVIQIITEPDEPQRPMTATERSRKRRALKSLAARG
jgi:hypothetical protein